jgi:hypothetical protein
MSTHTLHLTCCCGATLDYVSSYHSDLAAERIAFNQQHAHCQPIPQVPLNRALARAVRLAGRR